MLCLFTALNQSHINHILLDTNRFVFLTVAVPSFKPELISETVLQRLLKQNVVVNFKMNNANSTDCFIYTRGKHCDYFVIILEVNITIACLNNQIPDL